MFGKVSMKNTAVMAIIGNIVPSISVGVSVFLTDTLKKED